MRPSPTRKSRLRVRTRARVAFTKRIGDEERERERKEISLSFPCWRESEGKIVLQVLKGATYTSERIALFYRAWIPLYVAWAQSSMPRPPTRSVLSLSLSLRSLTPHENVNRGSSRRSKKSLLTLLILGREKKYLCVCCFFWNHCFTSTSVWRRHFPKQGPSFFPVKVLYFFIRWREEEERKKNGCYCGRSGQHCRPRNR